MLPETIQRQKDISFQYTQCDSCRYGMNHSFKKKQTDLPSKGFLEDCLSNSVHNPNLGHNSARALSSPIDFNERVKHMFQFPPIEIKGTECLTLAESCPYFLIEPHTFKI